MDMFNLYLGLVFEVIPCLPPPPVLEPIGWRVDGSVLST